MGLRVLQHIICKGKVDIESYTTGDLKMNRKDRIKRKAASILLIALVIFTVTACSGAGSTPEKTITNMYDAVSKSDEKAFTYTLFPKSELEDIIASSSCSTEEFWELQDECMQDVSIPDINGAITIIDKDPLDEEELSDLEDDFEEYFNVDIDIDEAYENVEIEFVDSNGDTDNEYIGDMYKTGGKWYIFMDDFIYLLMLSL